jgi:hypothetical protein
MLIVSFHNKKETLAKKDILLQGFAAKSSAVSH